MDYRNQMKFKFFDIIVKAEIYEDNLRHILGPSYALSTKPPSEDRSLQISLLKKIIKVSQALEKTLYQEKLGNVKQYAEKARSLIFNLNNAKNPLLKLRLLIDKATVMTSKGKDQFKIQPLSCEEIVKMDPKELASREVQMERQNILQSDMDARRTDWSHE